MSDIVLNVLVIAGSVLFAASVIIALFRIVRGPSILDRMIGTDVVLAAIMCGLGGYMALSDRTDLLPVLIVLAMLGFVGSVSVSRYVSKSDSMTPGAEAGALSDFSSSDWHMPREAQASGVAESGGAASAEAGSGGAASGAAPVSSGAVSAPPADEITENAEPAYDSHADVDGEGEGTGPDPGPDDAEHMATADDDDAAAGGGEGTNHGS